VLRARGQVAAEGVLMRSFGTSARAQWSVAVVPAVATALVSGGVGIVTGTALVGFVVPRADTSARDLPGFVGEVHPTGVILAIGASTVAALVAGTMSYVIARRATSEVLRAAD
jgi:membrane protein DedA with SNARE-associated domain